MSEEITILYSRRFQKQHKDLPKDVKEKSVKALRLFLENILHPSLRLHKLSGASKGLWSISLDKRYRIILRPMKQNTFLLISIGTHAIYDKV